MGKLSADVIEKIYSGWIGKIAGVIHGANIEGWTAENIEKTFGELTGLPFTFKNFCADDDINGPAFFQRAVLDYGPDLDLGNLADTFLNYVSDGHGFFWWGGYGISTEDTAYHNLTEGVSPSLSGSAVQNGTTVANQIGGQIFSDCWGLAYPGKPKEAADMAEKMASITHDQEGLNGARFVAAAIASAFYADTVDEILEKALSQIQSTSAYAKMVADVRDYVLKNREDFRTCFSYVKEHYDYRFYPGVCHIIPNAAVIVLALLCGKGDYADTINIAAMCGWDTDCNEGNLGTILGVFCGISRIPSAYKEQIGDLAICSSSLGYLNIQTVPQIAETTLRVLCKLNQTQTDEIWTSILGKAEGHYLHFQFPESTHALKASGIRQDKHGIRNIEDPDDTKKRILLVTDPEFENGKSICIYRKTYYEPEDFDDNRYQPDLSAIVYPGDRIQVKYRFTKEDIGKRIKVEGYYVDRLSKNRVSLFVRDMQISAASWDSCELAIPEGENQVIEEVGVCITGQSVARREQKEIFSVLIDSVELFTHPHYKISADHLFHEIWTAIDQNPVGFSYLRGIAEVANGQLGLSGSGKPAEMYTGNTNWGNYTFSAQIIPAYGKDHYILARVQGAMRWYAAGLISREGRKYVAILKKDREITILESQPYEWSEEKSYEIHLEVRGKQILAEVNQDISICYVETHDFYKNGCVGFGNQEAARTLILSYGIMDL